MAFAALLGAGAMSFVQLAGDRAAGPVGLNERSRCPRCQAQLRATEVLPVLGFMLLRGRCRECRAPIPRRHPLGELAAAAFWGAAVADLGLSPWLPLMLVAPLAALLLRRPVRGAGSQPLAAALATLTGTGLMLCGVIGLAEGSFTVYLASGSLGAGALAAGRLLAHDEVGDARVAAG